MEVWLQHVNKARAVQIVAQVLLLWVGLNSTVVLAKDNNDEHNIIVEEHATCDHIIPRFIEQIMNQTTSKCDESGVFPKPGNCSVFFKCAKQSDTLIQPFIEYCAVGYNFVNSVCVPNTNMSDCPQYTCRIPDGTNDIGNEVEVNDENSFQSLPLVVPSSTPGVIVESISSTTTTEKTTNSELDQADQNDSLMQMTQTQENSTGSASIHNNIMIISIYVITVILVH